MVTSNNREVTRVAKNTIMLYVRMAFLMVVGLITSRVNLDTLGIDNYGIYSLVGGFVALFVTLSGSFSAAISRFITYELGTGDEDSIKKVFSASIIVQIILSVLFVILAETIGLWFVNSYLHFPSGRLKAANIVYQISIVSFVISLLSVPYNSSIIAHEDMGVFAVISIIEGIGKLTIAYLTYLAPFDKLVFFSLLNCFLSLVIRLIYAGYCKNHYVETKTRITVDRPTIKRMISFSGWNFLERDRCN